MKNLELTDLIWAANNGNEDAKIDLGRMYYFGININKNEEKGLQLLNECINNNNINAILVLASIYINENRFTDAIPILEKGCNLDNGESHYLMFNILNELGDSNCIKYLDKAVLLNFEPACYTKAGLESDLGKKYELLLKAPHVIEAKYELGHLYLQDEFQNYKEALKIFKECAKAGIDGANMYLAKIYLFGLGVDVNMNEASKYTKIAANKGYKDAYFNLANMYLHGDGVKQSYKDAFYYFKLASSNKDINATHNLACLYYSGKGCKKNIKEAIRLFEYCGKNGNKQSYEALVEIYSNTNPELALYYKELLND